jgi:hypothetical protein
MADRQFLVNVKAPNLQRGAANPEGAVTGNVGDVYQRTGGGVGTTLYVKESGAGTTTGWARVRSTWTETEIDFGTVPVQSKAFTIVDASVAATDRVAVCASAATATGRVGNDGLWDSLLLSADAGVGEVLVTAYAVPGPVVGKRTIIYSIV